MTTELDKKVSMECLPEEKDEPELKDNMRDKECRETVSPTPNVTAASRAGELHQNEQQEQQQQQSGPLTRSPPLLNNNNNANLPGAYAMPGYATAAATTATTASSPPVCPSPGNNSSSSSSSLSSSVPNTTETNNFEEPMLVLLNAQPVDEALERERERRLEEQEFGIQNRDARIQELEHRQKQRWRRVWLFGSISAIVVIVVVVPITVHFATRKRDTIQEPPPTMPPQPWEQLGQDINGEEPYDNFGIAVDLSRDGHILAVGAAANDGGTGDRMDNRGHVRVFGYNSNTTKWVQLGTDLDGKLPLEQFGKTVSVSKDSKTGLVVAVGAPASISNDIPGRVRVFWYNVQLQQWTQWGLEQTGDSAYDDFGYEIASSDNGTVLAIGCPGCGGNGTAVGQVRVFKYTGTWSPMGTYISGLDVFNWFGSSVALSSNGTVVACGALGNNEKGYQSGSVRVFEYDNVAENWNQIGQHLLGSTKFDWFGHSVALSSDGDILGVGAAGANMVDKNGYINVYRYIRSKDEWQQIGQRLQGVNADDRFGISVDLSSDGFTVVGGAHFSDAKGHNDTGHARIFQYDSATDHWNQIGENIEGESAKDGAGRSVAVSGNGDFVAVASPWSNENGNHSGQVRVYYLNNNNNDN